MDQKTLRLLAILAIGGAVAWFLWQKRAAAAAGQQFRPSVSSQPLPITAKPKSYAKPTKKKGFDALLQTAATFGDDVYQYGKEAGANALTAYVNERSLSGW